MGYHLDLPEWTTTKIFLRLKQPPVCIPNSWEGLLAHVSHSTELSGHMLEAPVSSVLGGISK